MSPLLTAYLFLAVAIVSEVTATMLLQKTEQFTRLIASEAARYGQIIREAGIQPD